MRQRSGPRSPLAVLGFTAVDESLYRFLLRNPGLAATSVGESLGLPPADVHDSLDRLAEAGLVELAGQEVRVVPPDQGLGRLISDESRRLQGVGEQLESLRRILPSLVVDHLASQSHTNGSISVEVREGGDVLDLIRGLAASSTGDLMWLRPDQWRLPSVAGIDDWVKELVKSGRRSRAIYPARALEEAPAAVRDRAEAGEHVRVLAEVPSRVAILGRAAALIPERWGVNTGRRLVVREESLVCALTALFESMWDRAVAVPGIDGLTEEAGRTPDRALLLDQLARGAKDEQIARAMGMSLRTVRRRVAQILDELGVDSRFQAGVEAVRRGWV